MDEQAAKNLLSEIRTAEKQALFGFGGPRTDWKKVNKRQAKMQLRAALAKSFKDCS